MAKSLKKLGAALALLTSAMFATVSVQAAEPKVLNINNWSDYIAEDTIKNFEKERIPRQTIYTTIIECKIKGLSKTKRKLAAQPL